MPLDYLLIVMRDVGEDGARRLDAAKSAAPYLHHKLQPVDGHGTTVQTLIIKTGVPRGN